ncbi:MAG: HD domain-containing protein [Treponema sp.]|jgi:poly(A) polymerase|nr:HD domain-containing protein [Treponema sp.]
MAYLSGKPLEALLAAGFSVYVFGFDAIDSLLGRESGHSVPILTNADTADLARLFEDLRYPGVDLADAALDDENRTWYFHCADSIKDNRPSFSLLDFYQDCKSRVFLDPRGAYPLIARIRRAFSASHAAPKKKAADAEIKIDPLEILQDGLAPGCEHTRALMDAALILAKYFPPDDETELRIDKIAKLFNGLREGTDPGLEEQRFLLCSLMNSPNPGLGLELLKASGFLGKLWPELAILDQASHSKEFHPEGNAWKHTMETFRYRKAGAPDLRLSLGLLLHDTGKPIAVSAGSNRFNDHAQLGEIQARQFLRRLGFSASITGDICFLVRNHMIPAALPRLPLFRTRELMASPLFPILMELYRCDESSSFKGLDGYYESSAAYQSFLRNLRNPYRSADGKKLNQKPSKRATIVR